MCIIGAMATVAYWQSYQVAQALKRNGITMEPKNLTA
jgi:hypothetical protein